MYNANNIIFNSQSIYSDYCDGYHGNGDNYLLGLNLSIGVVKKNFSHEGSDILDKTVAFDLAETMNAFIGQINMITVSSFCGPMGAILGYDFLRSKNEFHVEFQLKHNDSIVNVFNANLLLESTIGLFGNKDSKIFPIFPGSHTFCAVKSLQQEGPVIIYAAIGLGIVSDRAFNANLMMEDVGTIPPNVDIESYKKDILLKLAQSILQVGVNQNMKYKEIFVGLKIQFINEDEIGCALVASPYFKIAQAALKNYKPEEFNKILLQDWLKNLNL